MDRKKLIEYALDGIRAKEHMVDIMLDRVLEMIDKKEGDLKELVKQRRMYFDMLKELDTDKEILFGEIYY